MLMLGYGYPELFCPAVKQHNIGADIFKKYFFYNLFIILMFSLSHGF